MIFMPCGDAEEVPGGRPMLYGVRPNEDLAIFQENGEQSPSHPPSHRPRSHEANARERGAADHSGTTLGGGEGPPVPGGRSSSDGPLLDVASLRNRTLFPTLPDTGCSISGKWTRQAQEHQLKPILFFAARDLEGGSCTIKSGVGPAPEQVCRV